MLRTHAASRRRASQFHLKTPSATTHSAFSINRLHDAPTYAKVATSTASTPTTPEASLPPVEVAPQAAPTPRRGRGRPRGSVNKSKLPRPSAPSTSATQHSVIPVKRGPGRPRKHPLPVAAGTAKSAPSNPITSESTSYASSQDSTRQTFWEGSLSPRPSDVMGRRSDDELDQLSSQPGSTMPASSAAKGKGKARIDVYTPAAASHLTLSPSRRSARISETGFSIERASARRDELDDMLLGKAPSPAATRVRIPTNEAAIMPIIAAPQPATLPAGIPVKRGRGRPRKHPLVLPQPDSVQRTSTSAKPASSSTQEHAPLAPIDNLPSSLSTRMPLSNQPLGMESDDELSDPPDEDDDDGFEIIEQAPPAKRTRRMSEPVVASEPVVKRRRGRPPGSGKKQRAALAAANAAASSASRHSLRSRASLPSLAAVKDDEESASPILTRRMRLSRGNGDAGLSDTLPLRKPLAALSAAHTPVPSSPMSTTPGLIEDDPMTSSSTQQHEQRTGKLAWKKKVFHNAGLYSNSTSAPSSSEGSSSRSRGKRPEVVDPTFPEPINFGATLLTQERDFRLPYSVFEKADQVRARVDAKRKPPLYNHIKTNKYYSRPKLQGELPLCLCKPESDCGDGCMNRILQYVCDPRACPCGERCTNVSLGKRPGVKTDVAYYGGRGFGLKTLEPIPKNGFIDEYRGEVINLTEATKRTNEEYKYTGNFYFLDYDAAAGEILDGGRRGNITRFANHSCSPNCYIEKWIICGTDESRTAEFQIGLFALRDIAADEELTYDYGWSAFRPRTLDGADAAEVVPQACLCGAPECRGILGAKRNPPPKAAAAPAKKKRGRPKAMTTKLKLGATRVQKAGALGGARKPDEAAVKLANKVIAKRAERFTRLQQENVESTPARQQARVESWRLFTNAPPTSPVDQPKTPTRAAPKEEEALSSPDSSAYSTATSSSPGSVVSATEAGRATSSTPARNRQRRPTPMTPEEAETLAAHRRARNAFLARVRRASKRGIIIEDPTQHPLKKQSIQCTAAPENTYIPDLPSTLTTLGMTTVEARKARNAFLARVRRGQKRGLTKEEAISMAAKPLPSDESQDTPVMRAQRLKEQAGGSEASFEGTSSHL